MAIFILVVFGIISLVNVTVMLKEPNLVTMIIGICSAIAYYGLFNILN